MTKEKLHFMVKQFLLWVAGFSLVILLCSQGPNIESWVHAHKEASTVIYVIVTGVGFACFSAWTKGIK